MKCHACGYKTFFDWMTVTCPKCDTAPPNIVAVYHSNPDSLHADVRARISAKEGPPQRPNPPKLEPISSTKTVGIPARREPSSFEVSQRIATSHPPERILEALEQQFSSASRDIRRESDGTLLVSTIEPTFGSINRSDTTRVYLQPTADGYLLIAGVNYTTSFLFWVWLLCLLFTWIGWLIPIAFYTMQKQTVQRRIESIFARIRDEFAEPPGLATAPSKTATNHQATARDPQVGERELLELLEKLGTLRSTGVLTDEEFQARKKALLSDLNGE